MTDANITRVHAISAMRTYDKSFGFLASGLFARKSNRVFAHSWKPWIYPHGDWWLFEHWYTHDVRNGQNADRYAYDYKGFFGPACGCGNLKRGEAERKAFETCPVHKIFKIELLGYTPSPSTPIGHSSAKPTPLVIPGDRVVSPEHARLAPEQPPLGGLYS